MNWTSSTINDLCILVTDGAHHSPKEVDYGYPMASSKDMLENDFDFSNIKKISEDEYSKLVSSNCKPLFGDVLLIKDGNSYLKKIFAIKEERNLVVLSSIAILRPNVSLINPIFLQYALRNPDTKKFMENFVSGAAIPRIVLKDFKSMRISIPDLQTQKRIANILSSYDDLIENNLKRIKLLEETAQNIYKEWFVNFRFPNYEHTDFDAVSGLPKGWEIKRLDEVYDFQNGYAFYTRGYSEEVTPYVVVDLGNISESGDFVVSGKEKFISESLYQDKERYYLNKYDIVVAMTDITARLGILAKVGIIDEDDKYVLNQRVGRLRSKVDYIDYCYLNASLSDEKFISEMHQRSKGAVQKYFNTKDIVEYNVVVPTKHIIDEFNIIYRPIIENRILLKFQNQKLKEASDILLPRLMNRTIEV